MALVVIYGDTRRSVTGKSLYSIPLKLHRRHPHLQESSRDRTNVIYYWPRHTIAVRAIKRPQPHGYHTHPSQLLSHASSFAQGYYP